MFVGFRVYIASGGVTVAPAMIHESPVSQAEDEDEDEEEDSNGGTGHLLACGQAASCCWSMSLTRPLRAQHSPTKWKNHVGKFINSAVGDFFRCWSRSCCCFCWSM